MSNKRNNAGENKPSSEGQMDSKVRRVRHSSNALGNDTLYFAIYIGLLALLGIVIGIVILRAPFVPSDLPTLNQLVKFHHGPSYYRVAKKLLKPLVQNPIQRWSGIDIDPNTGCVEVGNGVWVAVGTVDTLSTNRTKVRQPWIVYFLPETNTALFRKVGDIQDGDLAKVQSLTKATPGDAQAH